MIEIRKVVEKDHLEIKKIILDSFDNQGEETLVENLRTDGDVLAEYVIVKDQHIIGHVMYSKAKIGDHTPAIALAPMCIAPQFQKLGYGTMLLNQSLSLLKHLQMDIVVLGHSHYYPRFGFVEAIKYQITCPYPNIDSQYFMILKYNHIQTPGMFMYAKAFSQLT